MGVELIMEYKATVTKVAITLEPETEHHHPNPVFNCLEVTVDDEAAGSFLVLERAGADEPEKISMDWDEWDKVCEVVAKYREEWNWK
jgi:hypothetical protein